MWKTIHDYLQFQPILQYLLGAFKPNGLKNDENRSHFCYTKSFIFESLACKQLCEYQLICYFRIGTS